MAAIGDEHRDDANLPAGEAFSYAELTTAEALAERLDGTGREVVWRPVWVPAQPRISAALVALAATALGLVAIGSPVPSGLALVALLAIWSLELGGVVNPISPFLPKRATQDILADDPRGSTGAGAVLLLVRSDLPRKRSRSVAAASRRLGELTWLVIALTLAMVAARALEWNPDLIAIAQLVPSLLALGLLVIALLDRWSPQAEPTTGWTGIDQALSAIEELDREETVVRRSNLAVIGASDLDGTARALRADPDARLACRCWEYETGADVLEALGESVHED